MLNGAGKSVSAIVRKAGYVIREEGLPTFLNRAVRASIVRLRRRFRDNEAILEQWKSLKGAYTGRRAFVLGNGPSLNRTPLHLLAGEFTMCFNRFNLMFERLAWRPSAFSIIDDRVMEDMIEELDEILPQVEYAFFPDLHPYNIDFSSMVKPRDNLYWLFLDAVTFSDDLPHCGINKTVTNVGLQVLAYMGFSEIYLIGVDMEYKERGSVERHNRRDVTSTADDDPNHFDPRYFGQGRRFHHPRMDETRERFAAARTFFEARGCSIYNAGIGGKLDVFPRVELRELFPDVTPEDELALLLEPTSFDPVGADLQASVPNASVITSVEDWDPDAPYLIADNAIGPELVMRSIPTHVPLGPFNDQYLFVSREASVVARETAAP